MTIDFRNLIICLEKLHKCMFSEDKLFVSYGRYLRYLGATAFITSATIWFWLKPTRDKAKVFKPFPPPLTHYWLKHCYKWWQFGFHVEDVHDNSPVSDALPFLLCPSFLTSPTFILQEHWICNFLIKAIQKGTTTDFKLSSTLCTKTIL